MKIILALLMDYPKIKALQIGLRLALSLGASKKRPSKSMKKSAEEVPILVINYARILFNLIISPLSSFKQQFIDEQGLYLLKKALKRAFTDRDFEIYFYCLGIIPPLIITYPIQKNEFIENGYGTLLSE